MEPLNDSLNVQGTVSFEPQGEFVAIAGTLSHFSPGAHAFHVHEGASCDDFGGHYAPEGSRHGSPGAEDRHAGDLGNIVIEEGQSSVEIDRVDDVISLEGPQSIVGRTLIIHAGRDDYTTQPSGDAGPEIACGVIMESRS